MNISDISIRNRTAVGVLMVLIAALGVYSYVKLPREAFPDVQISKLVITTVREGVAPADMESSVTMKIEKKLAGLSGVKEVRSSSAEGISLIYIEFLPEVKIDDALQRVRDKVSQARTDLPDDLKSDPVVTEISFSDFPIMTVNMSGPISPVTLKSIADDLKDVIEVIPGVMNCDVSGALEREIRLEMDPDRVTAFGLSTPEVLSLIPAENVNISAGGLETAGVKFNVRTPAEFRSPEEAIHIPLTTRNGKTIYLDDVALVTDTFKDRDSYSRVNGQDCITLNIQKRAGGNIIEITDSVRKVLDEAGKQVPAGVKFDITMDQSKKIRSMIADLENHILTGLVLVFGVLLIFLGWRASMIVALAIPFSLMVSFAVLQWMGYTLNMIVLFSLIMVLGMLVDDAIVVVENIWRHMQMGYGKFDAAIKGTREVAMPVLTSTATKIAAFAPMALWPGMMGSFMKYLPITLVVTLSSSLFVAMVISPTICAAFGGKVRESTHEPFLMRWYRSLMNLVMAHRATAMSLTVLMLVALTIVYGKFGHGLIFFPEGDPEQAIVNVRCPQGTQLDESNRLAKIIERRIEGVLADQRKRASMDYVVTNVGTAGSSMFSVGAGGPHMASVTLMFRDFEERPYSSSDLVVEIRKQLKDIAGAEVNIDKQKSGPQTGAPITVEIAGKDFDELQRLSQLAYQKMIDVPNLVNLRSDFEATRPELAFVTDRTRASLLGLNPATIGGYLRTALWGSKVGTYRQFNDEYDITVRLPGNRRTDIDDLFMRAVPTMQGAAVPLSSLGTFKFTGGMGTINRLNQKRLITLTADNEGRQADEVLKDVQARLATLQVTPGYEIRYTGEKEEMQKAIGFLFVVAAPLALLLIFLVLVAEFNTLSVPLIIMSTVVLSMIGVLMGLLVSGLPFSVIMTGVGAISLTGVVVANGIVLLDFVRALQRKGLEVTQAAVQASVTRLRPVFLTAITAILGLLPMATGVSFDFHAMAWSFKSQSSQFWASMAIAVIYGLTFATVLTLVILPALYVSVYRKLARFGLGGLHKAGPEQQAEVEQEVV